MSLTTYVPEFHDVRALLGVSDDELSDTTIGLRVFYRSLIESFNEIDEELEQTSGTLVSEFAEVAQIANASRTADQQRFFENVQSYASFYVANDIAPSLPQFSPKTITDGKAMIQRHADSPYKVTQEALTRGLARALSRLKRAYQTQLGQTPSSSAIEPSSIFEIGVPDADPVLGT